DGQHPAVVVAALALDRRGVARQRRCLRSRYGGQALEVDDQTGGRLTGRGRRALALGEELADRDAVEVGELVQALHGHGAVAALVRADDDGLPAALALLLDPVQRQTLLRADGPEP